MSPRVGLTPKHPVREQGIRMEPPPSDDVAHGTMRAATAAALPPDEPPGERSRAHGFRDGGPRRFLVTAEKPSAEVLVFPTTMAPARRRRPTWTESRTAGAAGDVCRPLVVGMPRTSSRSLTAMGTPASGPTWPPRRSAAACAAASALASSCATCRKAHTEGSRSAIRARHASMVSTGVTAWRCSRSRSSWTLRSIRWTPPCVCRASIAFDRYSGRPATGGPVRANTAAH
mmetsp:Transcript_86758/g.246041  ORF Transcript_86758/g.246041 Transcript_86758/m.246041 type:complete len:230 (+) Transcript_86758:962-1651(+)